MKRIQCKCKICGKVWMDKNQYNTCAGCLQAAAHDRLTDQAQPGQLKTERKQNYSRQILQHINFGPENIMTAISINY